MGDIKEYIKTTGVLNLRVKLDNDKVYHIDLAKELRITDSNIPKAIKLQPQSYAFINSIYRDRITRTKKLEKRIETLEAKLITLYCTSKKSSYFREHKKLAAVNLAKYLAKCHPQMVKKQKQLADLTREREQLEVAVKAMEQRADLLRTLSANSRAERNNS